MPVDRINPDRRRFPSLTGRVMLDSVRGTPRMRAWPKKRGRNLPEVTKINNAVFTERTRLAKYAASQQIVAAMEATKGTGLYPRDLLMRAMATGIYDVQEPDGRIIRHRAPFVEIKMFTGVILELAVDQTIAINTWRGVNWPLPVIDTSNFWDAGSPQIITIPQGVQVIELVIGGKNNTGGTQTFAARALNKNNIQACEIQTRTLGSPGVSTTTGPLVVQGGDTFKPEYFITTGGKLAGAGRTYCRLNVLQAA